MKRIKEIQDVLINQVQNQMNDLSGVNTRELGEVVDMVKDLYESMYYCTIIKAMDEKEEQKIPVMRNHKEGRSPISRKTYMDSKENNQDRNTQIHELENYMAELSQDIMEMAQIASPEEKSILQKKLATLSTKIM